MPENYKSALPSIEELEKGWGMFDLVDWKILFYACVLCVLKKRRKIIQKVEQK
jgi:hypothetical protein